MRTLILALAFAFTTLVCFAQNTEDQIKRDANIDWAIKTNFAYQLQEGTPLKNAMALTCNGGDFFETYLEKLTNELVKNVTEEIVDTIYVFDPKTKKETITVVKRASNIKITSYELEQIWYRDVKNNSIKSTLVALSPISKDKVLGRIPMESVLASEFKMDDANTVWATLITQKLNFEDAVLLKGEGTTGFKNVLIDATQKGERKAFYQYDCKAIPADQILKLIGPSVDTIITFDPVTYIEKMRVINNKALEFDKLNNFKVKQVFYIDEKTKSLHCEVNQVDLLRNAEMNYPVFSIKMKE